MTTTFVLSSPSLRYVPIYMELRLHTQSSRIDEKTEINCYAQLF